MMEDLSPPNPEKKKIEWLLVCNTHVKFFKVTAVLMEIIWAIEEQQSFLGFNIF